VLKFSSLYKKTLTKQSWRFFIVLNQKIKGEDNNMFDVKDIYIKDIELNGNVYEIADGLIYIYNKGKLIIISNAYNLTKLAKYHWHQNGIYPATKTKGKNLAAHRYLMQAEEVGYDIKVDHKNRCIMDCRMENLRFATNGQNRINTKTNSNNILGVKGVYQLKNGKYRAYIRREKLGVYNTLEEAVAVRKRAEEADYGKEWLPETHIVPEFLACNKGVIRCDI